MATTESRSWATYCDSPRMLADIRDLGELAPGEGVDPGWIYGRTETEARDYLAEMMATGWSRGSDRCD